MKNPFEAGNYEGVQTYHVTTDDRIRRVKTFTREECEAALQVDGLQKTVERVILARLRKIDQLGKAPS